MVRNTTVWDGYPDILSSKQFSRAWIEQVFFPLAKNMGKLATDRDNKLLSGKRVRMLFYEPSERTLDSFISACDLLGAKAVWLGDPAIFSSQAKGESFADMIRVINQYEYDAIVLRSKTEGEADLAARFSNIPVINAGDGSGEHPTQALLDLFTIYSHQGEIDGVALALVGDLKNSRTIRSLVYLVSLWQVRKLYFVGPLDWTISEELRAYLTEKEVNFEECHNLEQIASEVDFVYLTRAQTERKGSEHLTSQPNSSQEVCIGLTDRVLSLMSPNAKILHPLPRSDEFNELPEEYTDDQRVTIFDQARNGLLARMAILKLVLCGREST